MGVSCKEQIRRQKIWAYCSYAKANCARQPSGEYCHSTWNNSDPQRERCLHLRPTALQVAGSDVIHRMAVSVGLGDVLASQALWYFECSSNSATSQPIIDVWSAACLYLAIRMHQLPISTAQVAAAVKQDSKLILKLFQKVATACKINPPAVDFTNFTLHSMTKMPGVQPATKVKVQHLSLQFCILDSSATKLLSIRCCLECSASAELLCADLTRHALRCLTCM